MAHIGIDIGTYTTLVAYVSDGQPYPFQVGGQVHIPSVIAVDERAGVRDVGADALRAWVAPDGEPGEVFRRWKLAMGDGAVLAQVRVGDDPDQVTQITPELLTTWLIEHAVGQLESGLGGTTVESVLVTVPHGWRRDNPEKCQATRAAAGAARVDGHALDVQPRTVSEPVAAAVYWLWAAKRNRRTDFAGRTVLVCDVGGGTFDLSLVRVAACDGEPHLVVDAVNNNVAGDYATALVLAQVLRQSNESFGTDLPTDADAILDAMVDGTRPGLRELFARIESFKADMSRAITYARARGKQTVPGRQTFVVPVPGQQDQSVLFTMTEQEFFDCLEPFFRHGRELVSRFLRRFGSDDAPWAVVYAGGGSRLAGIGERCLRPALEGLAPDPDAVLNRIPLNDSVIDLAVALGAALIASGIEQVEERLLYDIGLEFTIDAQGVGAQMWAALERETGLDLSGEVTLFVSPLLARGEPLPAECDILSILGEDVRLDLDDDREFRLLLDDDPDDPLIESWTPPPLPGGDRRLERLQLHVDPEGVVTLTFEVDGGASHRHTTPLRRTAKSRSSGGSILVVQLPRQLPPRQVLRISPQAWRRVLSAGSGQS